MNNMPRFDMKGILSIVAVLFVVACLGMVCAGTGLFTGDGDDDEDVDVANNDNDNNDNDNTTNNDNEVASADLGEIVTSTTIDRDGCATNEENSFEASEPIYVVAEDSEVSEGTRLFVRLYHEGEVVEDAPEIQADQDYDSTCINFVFEPTGADFEPGEYEAEFVINGNLADRVTFEVR